jgi:hypothetical protein
VKTSLANSESDEVSALGEELLAGIIGCKEVQLKQVVPRLDKLGVTLDHGSFEPQNSEIARMALVLLIAKHEFGCALAGSLKVDNERWVLTVQFPESELTHEALDPMKWPLVNAALDVASFDVGRLSCSVFGFQLSADIDRGEDTEKRVPKNR